MPTSSKRIGNHMYGEWWIENRADLDGESYEPPAHRVAGNMEATGPDNWTFEAIGSVEGRSLHSKLPAEGVRGPGGPAHIWGINAEGKAFSLLNSYPWQTTVRFGGIGEGTQVWHVGAIVEASNAWVTPDTEIDRFWVDFRGLGEWAWDRSDRTIDSEWQDDGTVVTALTVSLVPRVTEATVHDSPVKLSWRRTAPLTTAGSFPVGIGTAFSINDRLRLSEIAEKWLYPLGRLLSLLTLAEAHITSINARLADSERNGPGQFVSIRLPQRIQHNEEDQANRDHLTRFDMMATLADLKQQDLDLGTLLQAHFALEADAKLRDTLTHFLDSQSKDDNGPDDALRCLFNAIENYHSARFDGMIPDEPDLSAEIDQIVRKSSRDHRNEIAARLKNRRQKSMKAKLAEIVDSCGEAAQRVLYLHPELVDDAYQARNELAHTNPTTSNRWLRQQVLQNLQWLMRHALLRELGLTASQADSIFRLTGRPFSQYVGHV